MTHVSKSFKPSGNIISASSQSELTLSTGLKAITLNEDNVAFIPGHRIRVVSFEELYDFCYMEGYVESIEATLLKVRIDYIHGPEASSHSKWVIGITGDVGRSTTGEQGPKGDKGDPGEKGEIGPQGPLGPRGEAGDAGPIGPEGIQGPIGPVGPRGEKGDPGPQGEIGPEGKQGDIGPKGEDGKDGKDGKDAPVTYGISRSVNEIGTGNKTFILEESAYGYGFTTGMRIRISRPFVQGFWMEGAVNYFLRATGEINLIVDRCSGAGSFNNWSVNVSGEPGFHGYSHPGLFPYDNALESSTGSIIVDRIKPLTSIKLSKQAKDGTHTGKLWLSGRQGGYIYITSRREDKYFRAVYQIMSIVDLDKDVEILAEEIICTDSKWPERKSVLVCY